MCIIIEIMSTLKTEDVINSGFKFATVKVMNDTDVHKRFLEMILKKSIQTRS